MKSPAYLVHTVLCILCASLLLCCAPGAKEGEVHITYWEHWSGFEAEAMQRVVDDFNASQDRIVVHMMSVSDMARKLLTAIAGGNPPDVAGTWSIYLPKYAEQWALIPLDPYLEKAGITATNYIPVFWNVCQYRGHTWALPTTPGTTALIWNKDLFREVGLDPEKPPRTIAELNEYADKLTKRDKDGNLIRLGFLPTEPGWWNFSWPHYFGGSVWDGTNTITYDTPAGRAALDWIASFSRKYGLEAIQQFGSGFGNFASPQNAFLASKVAMEIQGVWMYNFIQKYAPGLDWGAAPFPSVYGNDTPCVYTEADVLAIPRGSKHPDEAFEFIKYVNSRGPMEKLCIGQRKASPLSSVSEDFYRTHPHPYLRMFHESTWSPRAFSTPKLSIHEEIVREVNDAVDRVRLLEAEPDEAARVLQKRCQRALDRMLERRDRREIPGAAHTH